MNLKQNTAIRQVVAIVGHFAKAGGVFDKFVPEKADQQTKGAQRFETISPKVEVYSFYFLVIES